ncbi:MAG: tetratricopeptide repeat protein [Betaproteobacteria bacterium]|nr:tetratricopeptide repeat protein [Betaproteobacteria bacterium]MBI2961720.1 tetratricopeptide repeat protein [Betaproteobacteria bacterium]
MNRELEHFATLVSREHFDLAEASLLLARDAYPGLEVSDYMAQLDDIAAAIRRRIALDAFAEQKVIALNYFLFNEMRFSGNIDDYYDPRNSYLNEVMERRSGIPITLSVIYLEVGRRLGLNLRGVSFPGHFLVKLAVTRGQLVLDPFAGGVAQSESELRQRLAQVLPPGKAENVPLDPFLEAATPRQIIARMLRNLKNIYVQTNKLETALAVMHRMLLVVPESAEELRDRGIIYQQLECSRAALSDLQNYLRRRPEAPDSGDIYTKVVELKQACARLN